MTHLFIVFYTLTKIVISLPIRILFKTRMYGRIPKKGGFIVASNHDSFLDHFIFPAMIKRRITYLAKAELFEKPVSNFLFTNWGGIPVYRGEGKAEEMFRAAIKHIKSGGLMGIYPEGTRSPDGTLWKGHSGVARLALMTGRPVIPVGMIGSFEALPKGKTWPRFTQVKMRIGKPMDFSVYKGMHDDREITRKVTDSIMEAIGELTGEEYDPEKGYMNPKIMPKEMEGKQ